MEILFLFAMVVGFMLIGVPIAVSLGLSSILFLLIHSDASLASVAQTLFNAFAGHYTLLAIPFFILASSFMSTGGVAKRIIRFAIAMVGWFRGGLAMASVVACMMFAALSGSSPATVVAIGSIVIAGMIKNGYSKEFAAGVICNAGTLGILIPPSIVMVVYAAATDVSVGRMFLGGVIPGLLAGVMLMIAIYIAARVKNLPKQPFVGWKEVFSSAKDASWGLLLVVIILGGIYGGIFTPTEASAVAAAYAMFIGLFVLKSLKWKDVPKVMTKAAMVSSVVLLLVGAAMAFKTVVSLSHAPEHLAEFVLGLTDNPYVLLFLINILLFVVGMFLDAGPAIIILGPILGPVFVELGVHPVHFAIIMSVNLTVGLATPPMGLVLFVASSVSGERVETIAKAILPFLAVEAIVIFLITYFPSISMTIPLLTGFAK